MLKSREMSDSIADMNQALENEEDSDQLRDELNACQHFFTDTDMRSGRHKVINFQLSKLYLIYLMKNWLKPFKNLIVQKPKLPWHLCYDL